MFHRMTLIVVMCAAPAMAAAQPFTIAAIPDTQIQSLNDTWNQSFFDQTRWIRDNAVARNIVLATHLGDVVQGEIAGLETIIPQFSWQNQLMRTSAVMEQLDLANTTDGLSLPYSASAGNHDFLPTGEKENFDDPIEPTGFTTYYGPSRYQSYGWYGGGDSTGFNHYQYVDAGAYQYLHINLEYEPENPDIDDSVEPRSFASALDWAQSIIDANPGMPTIVSTHKYLTDLEPDGFDATGYQGDGFDDFFGGERTPTGEAVWQQFIRGNAQIFMTLNGHDHEGPYREDGEYAQVSYNDAGLPVFEILADYQDYVNPLTGSDPYLRLIEFDPDAGTISNKTYSPTFDLFNNDPQALEDRLNAMLDEFEAGVPVTRFLGEDFAQVILFEGLPTSATLAGLLNGGFGEGFAVLGSRADAEAAILEFFGAADRVELAAVDLSAYLTDPDSQFTFDVTFDENGRPIPEPASFVLLVAGAALLGARARRAGA